MVYLMEELMDLLSKGVTQYHVVRECENRLSESGYTKLYYGEDWNLSDGGKYYISPYPSVLFAFAIGKDKTRLRIGAAHTDFPMLKLKPSPDMNRQGYWMVNVEPYGGLIMETWFDRPLGLAGKVVVEGKDIFHPDVILYNSDAPLFVIPSLAPHLRRGDGKEKLDPQKELIPLYRMEDDAEETGILDYVAKELNIAQDKIADYDLYLYNMDRPELIGKEKEFISSPRIDNISSVSALIETMCEPFEAEGIDVIALFDNEEIGSRSKQGADSVLFAGLIERIYTELGIEGCRLDRVMRDSFMLSLDVAHGTHPNYSEKSDPTNRIKLGAGAVLKTSAGQRYVTDSSAGAVITLLGRKNNIAIQRQVNKSGMAGGQTLGPIISSYVPVRAVDMGIPVLAMHSARELAHVKDYEELVKLLKVCLL
jgi:aspartyl aminopeptidase